MCTSNIFCLKLNIILPKIIETYLEVHKLNSLKMNFVTCEIKFQACPRAIIRRMRRILARTCGIITMMRLRAGRSHKTRILAMHTYCFIIDKGPT